MNSILRTLQSVGFCLFVLSAPPMQAQTAAPMTEIGMYGFLPSISGTSQLGTLTSDIDVPFKTLLENFDIGFAGYTNHRRGKWSFIADVSYSELSTGGNNASTPILSLTVNTKIKQMWAAGYVGYQIYEQKYGDAMLGIDVLGGLRYNKLNVGLSANASGLGLATSASLQRDEYWIDNASRLLQDRTFPSFNALCIQPIHQRRKRPCKQYSDF